MEYEYVLGRLNVVFGGQKHVESPDECGRFALENPLDPLNNMRS